MRDEEATPLGVVKGLVESRATQAGRRLECDGRDEDGRIEGPSGKEFERTSHVPRVQHLSKYHQKMGVSFFLDMPSTRTVINKPLENVHYSGLRCQV